MHKQNEGQQNKEKSNRHVKEIAHAELRQRQFLVVIDSYPEVFEPALNLPFFAGIQNDGSQNTEQSKQNFDWPDNQMEDVPHRGCGNIARQGGYCMNTSRSYMLQPRVDRNCWPVSLCG